MAEVAPKPANDDENGLVRLKSLLFRGEAARLAEVESHVDALDQHVGDPKRLEAATADILVGALRRAEVARHRELSQAIAPVIVAAMRSEIQNSREMMVEALYPLMGQLVVAAVANAIRDAMAAINERLDALTSLERWKLRLQALFTGRPVSELALAKSRRTRLLRALFLERGSGALLASWRADHLPEEKGEIIGGLIAALGAFARDALGDGSGDLRTLDFEGRNIEMRATATHLIACEYSLPLRATQKARLDQDCYLWIEQFNREGVANDATFAAFVEDALARGMKTKPRKRRMGWPMRLLMALVLLGAASAAARASVRAWREHRLQAALAAHVADDPELVAYPLRLDVDHAAGKAVLTGLAPSRAALDATLADLRGVVDGYDVDARVSVVATDAVLASNMAGAREQNAALGGKIDSLSARVDSLAAGATADASALAQARADLDQLAQARRDLAGQLAANGERLAADAAKLDGVSAKIADIEERTSTPRARLASLIGGFAIYFDKLKPNETPEVDARLDRLATLMRDNKLALRVVGYADDTGSDARNKLISTQRADALAQVLVDRGVDRDRLSVIGRATSNRIAPSTPGRREINRRVEFELPNEGEFEQ